jgi:hypothetical protein
MSEQVLELLFHFDVIEEGPAGVRGEGGEEVDVGIGAEVVAEGGAEDFEAGDLPAAAEVSQGLAGEGEVGGGG